jgi:hypothetical protein
VEPPAIAVGLHDPPNPSGEWSAARLSGGPPVAWTSGRFWGLVLQTTCPSCIASNASIDAFLDATPFTTFRLGQDSDRCNASAYLQYADNGSVMGPCSYDVPAFQQWCTARLPTCQSIIDLPAENNNSTEDASIARFIVEGVGFQPTYWAFGNEPMGWTHYGIPWSNWSVSDDSTPTPIAYALDVRAAIAAVKAVDPSGRFIGIEAARECNWDYFEAVLRVDGPSLSAIAYQSYPSTARITNETLLQFYDPLASPTNITTSYATVRADVAAWCDRCATLPTFVTEYDAGPGWAPSDLAGTNANAVFLAASSILALEANVSLFAISELQSYRTNDSGFALMNLDGSLPPTGELFPAILDHLALGEVYRTSVQTSVPNVWVILTGNGSTRSLLFVNTNLDHGIDLELSSTLPPGALARLYTWSPSEPGPTSTLALISASYKVPPQGILLVDSE